MHGKLDSDSVLQWECLERRFKSGAGVCWAGTLRTAVLPANERIEDGVYSHSEQLGREIRKVHSEGISQPPPSAAGGCSEWRGQNSVCCEGSRWVWENSIPQSSSGHRG